MNNTLANKTLLIPAASAKSIASRYKWISLDLVEPNLGAPLNLPLEQTDTYILSSNNQGTERGWIKFSQIDTKNLVVNTLSAESISAYSIIATYFSALSVSFVSRRTENQEVTGNLTVAGNLFVDNFISADKAFFRNLTALNFDLGGGGAGGIKAKFGIFDSLSSQTIAFDTLSGDGRNLNPVGELIFNRPVGTARMFTINLPISGSNNFYFGVCASPFATISANDNLGIGYQSGFINEIGNNNINIGKFAGFRNLSSDNVYIGYNAGLFNELGSDNIYIGRESGWNIGNINTSVRRNVVLGSYHLVNNSQNVILGYGNNSSRNTNVVLIGTNKTAVSSNDIIIGEKITVLNGDGQVLINSLYPLTGFNNTIINTDTIGYGSFTQNSNNIHIGPQAGKFNTSYGNIIIGAYAGFRSSGPSDRGSYHNIIIGTGAGEYLSGGGNNNIILGPYAHSQQWDKEPGFSNIVIGYSASSRGWNNSILLGRSAAADRNNRFVVGAPDFGSQSRYDGTFWGTFSATEELFAPRINSYEMYTTSLTSLSHVVRVFYLDTVITTLSALSSADFLSLSGGLVTGTLSARTLSGDGLEINPIGPFRYNRDLFNINTWFRDSNSDARTLAGNDNLFIGREAGANITVGTCNIFFGRRAGVNTTLANNNVFIGSEVGCGNTTGCNNVLIGLQAGRFSNNVGNNNVILGTCAAANNNANSNTILGDRAGFNTTNGGDNVFLGAFAGSSNSTGLQNIYIGASAGGPLMGSSSTYSNVIGLGINVTASASNQFLVGSWGTPISGKIFGPLEVDSLSANNAIYARSIFTTDLVTKNFTLENVNLDNFTANRIEVNSLTAYNAVLSGDGSGLNPIGPIRYNRHSRNIGAFNVDVDISNRGGTDNIAFGQNSSRGLYKGSNNIYIGSNTGSVVDARNEKLSAIRVVTPGSYVVGPGRLFKAYFQGTCIRPASALPSVGINIGSGNFGIDQFSITDFGEGYKITPTIIVRYEDGSGTPITGSITASAIAILNQFEGNNTILIGNSAQGVRYSNSVGIGAFVNLESDNSLVLGSQLYPFTSGTIYGPLDVKGHFSAVTKSFLIKHPIKKNKHLQYGSLEGPELGVYYRGKTNKNIIKLPKVWEHLVHEDSITVQLTPVGKEQNLYVISYNNKQINVGNVKGSYFYTVYGERKDVPKLEVEV